VAYLNIGKMEQEEIRKITIVYGSIIGSMILADYCSEDEESASAVVAKRQRIVKVEGYAERIVPAMTDVIFKQQFRLTRTTFRYLLERMAPILLSDTGANDKSVCFFIHIITRFIFSSRVCMYVFCICNASYKHIMKFEKAQKRLTNKIDGCKGK
jgi:hypothetical protein